MADRQCDILAFGAHAADIEFSCGAVIAKHTQRGDTATLVHLTLGEAGHPGLSAEDYAEQKRVECQQAAEALGAGMRWLPYPDAALPATPEVELAVCDLIRELRPRTVLNHWRGSFHRDHVLSHHLVMQGLALARAPSCERPLPPHSVESVFFPENWEDPQGFRPEVFIDVSESYDAWLEAANKYALFRGEVASFPYRQYYESLAFIRGAECGCARAAALMRSAEIWKTAQDYLT
jgi:LmbE family N-acetylglucosaminyl deacetylase